MDKTCFELIGKHDDGHMIDGRTIHLGSGNFVNL